MNIDFITIFCFVDDFSKGFFPYWKKKLLQHDTKKRHRPGKLNLSEIITILIGFHTAHFDCFKSYYKHILLNHSRDFDSMPCYERFTAIIKKVFPILCYILKALEGRITSLSFIDSTCLPVCKNIRIRRHKTFKMTAGRGKTSVDWFFGFKLHIVINEFGEIISLMITSGNINDRWPVHILAKKLSGILIGDRGYISTKLTEELKQKGITLLTRVKKNMKKSLTDEEEKLMKKRSIIETIFGKRMRRRSQN